MQLPKRTHYKKHSLETTWFSMHLRCKYPRTNKFEYYGGRGITVCRKWDCFEAFLRDMGPKPAPHYQLDRINSDGNYSKSNCRWIPGRLNRSRK